MTIDTSKPVLVTGATGYIAGWIVRRLLEEGATVHAAVRDPENKKKVAHLDALAEQLPGAIRYFRADLLEEGSYREAMEGCGVVFHTASPFTSKYTDPQRDLVDPAVKGTRNVLQQAAKTSSVTRVVVTSSVAAVYGDNQDRPKNGDKFAEEDWNTTSTLTHQSYSCSKVMAEREAWKIADAQTQFRLVTVNPSFVMGPNLADASTSESFAIIGQMIGGMMRTGAPALEIAVVDVRDVAEQHVRAAFHPDAHGRYICSAQDSSYIEIAASIRRNFGSKYAVPSTTLPKWLVWLIGPMLNKLVTREFVTKNIGHPLRIDHGRSVRELGMTYRPLDETTKDMVEQMVRAKGR